MNGKISRLQDLLAAGWEVDDIVSDDDRIEVLLARGAARAGLTLDRADAWDVLYGPAFELRGRPARPDDREPAVLRH